MVRDEKLILRKTLSTTSKQALFIQLAVGFTTITAFS